MMITDQKKAVGTILSKMDPYGRDTEHDEPDPAATETMHAKQAITRELLGAIGRKNIPDVAAALEAFWEEMESQEQEE